MAGREASVRAVANIDQAITLSGTADIVVADHQLMSESVAVQDNTSCLLPRLILLAQPSDMVEAIRFGAMDVLAAPANDAELRIAMDRAFRDWEWDQGLRQGRRPRKSDVIIGSGKWLTNLFAQMSMVAKTDTTVCLSGESGTGKELVARTIHHLSDRCGKPFVVLNCAAIPETLMEDELFGHVRGAFTNATKDREGMFAAANTGTMFLDEIGEMPLNLQAKLLRVLQTHEFRRVGEDVDTTVDFRLVTATNRNLEEMVAQGTFREDLYYRISVFPVTLPPLRSRMQDIPLLAFHFLQKLRKRLGKNVNSFSQSAMDCLQQYSYPGNVRELENIVHRAMVLATTETIEADCLRMLGGSPPVQDTDLSKPFRELKSAVIANFEYNYLRALLLAHNGNVAAAGRCAGMDRKNLWGLCRKHSIDANQFRKDKKE